MAYRTARAVEIGEASESSDDDTTIGEKKIVRSHTPTGIASSFETSCSITTVTPVSLASVDKPATPTRIPSLIEKNLALGKTLQEIASLPYAVAIKEIDDITLDLIQQQQRIDDTNRKLGGIADEIQSVYDYATQGRAKLFTRVKRAQP